MLCEELMEREVEWASPGDTVLDAARKMREFDVGFLPVCEADGRVIGVITDRDIALRVVAQDLSASTNVSNAMTKDVVYCNPTDEVGLAEKRMGERQISRIVCLGDDRELLGVISLSDILDVEEEKGARQMFQQVKAGHRGASQPGATYH